MRGVLHHMMKSAFIEIRASDSINASKKIADVFHALPTALLSCSTNDDYQFEYSKLLERAKRWGLDRYLENVKEMAIESVAKQSGSEEQ